MIIRKPTVADVPAMVQLMRPHVLSERLLPRTARQVAEHIRDYVVAEDGDRMVGVGSMALVDVHLAEIGAVAGDSVEIETALVERLILDAQELGVGEAFVLTDAPSQFEALGFSRTTVAAIPEKRDRQCLRCSRLPRCRQVALVADLGAGMLRAAK